MCVAPLDADCMDSSSYSSLGVCAQEDQDVGKEGAEGVADAHVNAFSSQEDGSRGDATAESEASAPGEEEGTSMPSQEEYEGPGKAVAPQVRAPTLLYTVCFCILRLDISMCMRSWVVIVHVEECAVLLNTKARQTLQGCTRWSPVPG